MGEPLKEIVVSRETTKRIASDVREVIKDTTLKDNNIFYEHNMDNFLKGTAMLIGPSGTPYENGMFIFRFLFPTTYPYNPPKVTFLNCTDERVRMNPNLYENGRVCLSVLNTWDGEPWSSCQTIRSVLLTLITVLNPNPLLNEPGIGPENESIEPYNRIVRFKSLQNYYMYILQMLKQNSIDIPNSVLRNKKYYSLFSKTIFKHFEKNHHNVLHTIKYYMNDNIIQNSRIYDMRYTCDYMHLEHQMLQLMK